MKKNLNADHLSSHIENTRKTPNHISTFRSLPSPISVCTSLQPKRRQLCFCSWKWSMFQWESLYLRNGVALRWPLDFGETNIHTSGILGFPAEPTIPSKRTCGFWWLNRLKTPICWWFQLGLSIWYPPDSVVYHMPWYHHQYSIPQVYCLNDHICLREPPMALLRGSKMIYPPQNNRMVHDDHSTLWLFNIAIENGHL